MSATGGSGFTSVLRRPKPFFDRNWPQTRPFEITEHNLAPALGSDSKWCTKFKKISSMSSKASYDNYFKRNCFLFEKKELEPEPTNNFGSGRGSIVIKPRLMVDQTPQHTGSWTTWFKLKLFCWLQARITEAHLCQVQVRHSGTFWWGEQHPLHTLHQAANQWEGTTARAQGNARSCAVLHVR